MRILLFIALNFCVFSLKASNFVFERINTENGLSQNDVINIYKDSQGYLWFATNEGANRYDGVEFVAFRISDSDTNSISSNLISSFTEDSKGNIWIATQDNGVCKYDPVLEKFTNFYNSATSPNLLSSNTLRAIHCDSKDRIFVATYYGIDYIEESVDGTYEIKHVTTSDMFVAEGDRLRFISIQESENGDIIVLMGQGLGKMFFDDSGEVKLKPFLTNLKFYGINSFYEFDDDYFVGHLGGFSRVPKEKNGISVQNISTFSCGVVTASCLVSDNTFLVGTSSGMYRVVYDKENQNKLIQTHYFSEGERDSDLSNNSIKAIWASSDGIIWIGTNGGGICKYNPFNNQFRKYNAGNKLGSLNNKKVLSIFEDSKQNLWIGTEGGGVNYLPKENSKNYKSGFTQYYYNNIPGEQQHVFDFCEINSNEPEIWVGTGYKSRMASLKKTNNSWELIRSYIPISRGIIFNICKDENGVIWLANYNGGLFRASKINNNYKVDQFDMSNSNIGSNVIRSIIEDSKGRLWIGTSNGLVLIPRNEKSKTIPEFKIFRREKGNEKSLSHNYILPILETKAGEIWVGTMGKGLNKLIEDLLSQEVYFKRFTADDGLANNTIKEMIEDDDGNIWIGTNRGLSKLDPLTESFVNFGVKDGLQSYEFCELSGCKRSDGEIIFGGINGFNAFYPHEIKADTTVPKVVLNSLEILDTKVSVGDRVGKNIILNKSLNTTDEITLSYSENNFAIHFAALHFSKPELNKYKYRLVGYDKDWIKTDVKSRFAKYTSLNDGEYYFEVLASNGDGYWSKEPKRIKIVIKPPYWQTSLFRVLLIILLSVFILTAYYLKIISMRKQKRMLEELVKERTIKLRETNQNLVNSKEELTTQKEELQSKSTELEYHKENLEKLVHERTKELEQAKNEAEESDRLKSSFLANMSHEIRTPMNAIVGFASLINGQEFDEEELSTYLAQIEINSTKLLVLIDDILDSSMIEANQLRISISEFSINKLLVNCITTAQVNSERKELNIELENKIEAKNYQVTSDLVRLNQIIDNLLNNALKYTHEGFVKLKLDEIDDGGLSISVHDSGIGIEESDLQHVFDRFRKIEKSSKILYPGVGLGLSISIGLAKILGFEMCADSKPGKGSSFYLSIPKDKIKIQG